MQLQAGCEMMFEVAAPTPTLLMLRPRSGHQQWVASEAYHFAPRLVAAEYADHYGNLCQRVVLPEGRCRIWCQATVDAADQIDVAPDAPFTLVQEVPDEVLQFLLPSRYCQSDTEQIFTLAQEIVTDTDTGYAQVEAIRAWIHANLKYQYGTSSSTTSALETTERRAGVCRDFVHLGLALCRSLSIPARMVVGYLYQLDPMDQHAWFEAFVGGRWYIFDATQEQPRGGRIAIAYGRDAADVALATQFGPATLHEMHVWVQHVTPEANT
jgi:transglutaminase-like putative cysteine protease